MSQELQPVSTQPTGTTSEREVRDADIVGLSADEKKFSPALLTVLAFMALGVMFTEISVVPSIPKIVLDDDFSDRAELSAWILSIYNLVGAIANPVFGVFGDAYGKRRMMLIALGFYEVGVLLAYFSTDMIVLLIGRGFQGCGMAAFPMSMSIIRETFPAKLIPMSVGLVSSCFSIGVTVGFLGGGAVVDAFDWKAVFLVSAVIMAVLMILLPFLVNETQVVGQARSIDWIGLSLLAAGVTCILAGITLGKGTTDYTTQVTTSAWTEWYTIGIFVVGVVFLVVFFIAESKVAEPLFPKEIALQPGIFATNLCALAVGFSMFTVFSTLPTYLMIPKKSALLPNMYGRFGYTSSFDVGLLFIGGTIAQLFMGAGAGLAVPKFGALNILSVAILEVAGATFLLAFWNDTATSIVVQQTVMGIGMGTCMVCLISAIAENVSAAFTGIAFGMNVLLRLIGASIGPILADAIQAEVGGNEGYEWGWIAAGISAVLASTIAIFVRPKFCSCLKEYNLDGALDYGEKAGTTPMPAIVTDVTVQNMDGDKDLSVPGVEEEAKDVSGDEQTEMVHVEEPAEYIQPEEPAEGQFEVEVAPTEHFEETEEAEVPPAEPSRETVEDEGQADSS